MEHFSVVFYSFNKYTFFQFFNNLFLYGFFLVVLYGIFSSMFVLNAKVFERNILVVIIFQVIDLMRELLFKNINTKGSVFFI